MKSGLYYRTMKTGLYWGSLLLFCLGILPAGCRKKEVSDNPVSYHLGMAKAFYRQGNYQPAIEMYEKTLALEPDCAEAYLQLGIIYDDNLKDKERAVRCYRKYLELSPHSEMSKMVREWMKKSKKKIEVPAPSPGTSPRALGATPVPSPLSVPTPPPGKNVHTYQIKSGDTLAGLAGRFYGDRQKWKKIYQANRDRLASPDRLQEGQMLIIPPR